MTDPTFIATNVYNLNAITGLKSLKLFQSTARAQKIGLDNKPCKIRPYDVKPHWIRPRNLV